MLVPCPVRLGVMQMRKDTGAEGVTVVCGCNPVQMQFEYQIRGREAEDLEDVGTVVCARASVFDR